MECNQAFAYCNTLLEQASKSEIKWKYRKVHYYLCPVNWTSPHPFELALIKSAHNNIGRVVLQLTIASAKHIRLF